ncbi:MAG: 3'(2'),5'-bisphosphate nucleotidase CysQ [Alphaproteobacteria bacterium]|jgi:3'(2'), 5'-bisphosphate nucleotidase|nr:3'(2'),5'-bisphosphate nucleotidase CysQ [Alphaproteobacteria bacterium]MDP6819030.1 3'(2'),5'-bisphosphate nucleotidase CysQ [Alphaproteobacteria bacterium]
MTENERAALAQLAHRLALRAGVEIMRLYRRDIAVQRKVDSSPVTEADEIADALIVAGLADAAPNIPTVSEESVAQGRMPDIGGGRFWLVDPLDGTKEFISGTDEFTVNIALIENGSPVLGALHAPALGECYLADGGGAFLIGEDGGRKPIRARALPADGAVVVASRHHRDSETDEFIARHHTASVTSAGSALKFGLLAKGEADLYPRFGRTMEWDTAAGHAVLAAAGGSVRSLDGTALQYGKRSLDNPHFVARGLE